MEFFFSFPFSLSEEAMETVEIGEGEFEELKEKSEIDCQTSPGLQGESTLSLPFCFFYPSDHCRSYRVLSIIVCAITSTVPSYDKFLT